ncbi:uncharacterized protein LOC129379084 isoform X2 [Poeciliopsis prolifica]|uniref:uncharacterized protein LOC129379084 isoform X2 n=1 Tax=Poeciliopsis prolifica TaxID=188132 RepID=UPI0024132FCA|nr:uncharacterized protein LOC129379084 isoform X2 [Poeciliopsis prolifica]
MCSVEPLREFIRERLTAAAEEIFTQLEKTIVRYEEEIDRQRRLLDLSWTRTEQNPAGVPQHYNCKEEEVEMVQQPCSPAVEVHLDQEELESVQVKEEHNEHCVSQNHLAELVLAEPVLKEETDTFKVSPVPEQDRPREPESNRNLKPFMGPVSDDDDLREPEPNTDQNSADSEDQNQKKSNEDNSDSSTEESEQDEGSRKTKLKRPRKSDTNYNLSSCKICAKSFTQKYLIAHMRTHTGFSLEGWKCLTFLCYEPQ